MKHEHMRELIKQLNGCLTWKGFMVVGLDEDKAGEVLQEWFNWYKKKVSNSSNKE